jgi:hypothetical protein
LSPVHAPQRGRVLSGDHYSNVWFFVQGADAAAPIPAYARLLTRVC